MGGGGERGRGGGGEVDYILLARADVEMKPNPEEVQVRGGGYILGQGGRRGYRREGGGGGSFFLAQADVEVQVRAPGNVGGGGRD